MSVEGSRRRVLLPDGASIVEPNVINQLLFEADTPAQPDAAAKLNTLYLSPRDFLATTIIHLGTLQFDFGNGWEDITPVVKTPDIKIEYQSHPSQQGTKWRKQSDSGHRINFKVETVKEFITIEVVVNPSFGDHDNDLSLVLSQLENETITDKKRQALEEKRDELLVKLKQFVIDKLAAKI